ncbi:Lpg1974 family pore-forming outer membrane protein [Estrella lausannensis]|uniref:Outer membrane protein n=1 Tax=Estrella lausannensis TaxID=483423 RepID=A0A0H5DPX0_9BACT|nr:Lpg1974 family pore-forming outer membrane protein [Estrella lausannensis]CRX38641.1 Outer membrane protein [Estrella lausannensis]
MRKLNMKLALAALHLSLLAIPLTLSGEEAESKDSSCGGMSLEVGIDFIYWKPCVDDLDFALVSDDIIDPEAPAPLVAESGAVVGKYRYLHPHGQGGVKARLGKSDIWNGWDFFFSYTYAASSACGCALESPPGHAWPTLMHAQNTFAGNSVCGKYRLHYQEFDALLSHKVDCGACGYLVPFFGFDSLFLYQNLKSEATDVVDTIIGRSNWRSDLSGAGLKVGCEYRFEITDGLGVYTKASGALLAAQDCSHYRSERENIEEGVNVPLSEGELKFKSKENIIVPGYALGIGAYYRMESEELKAGIHIGYEFVQWFNIPNQRRFPAGGESLARHYSNTTSQLGFHGVTAGFDIGF